MNLIAAADKNMAIGNKGKLLYSIPGDMKFFRTTTTGKVVVMGRKTLESFPGQNPLKNRVNIVLTRNAEYKKDGAVICTDIEMLKKELEKYDTNDIFVIGGEEIYRLLLPMCDKAYITRIDSESEADAYLPDLDSDDDWHITSKSETYSENGLDFRFVTYERKRRIENVW